MTSIAIKFSSPLACAILAAAPLLLVVPARAQSNPPNAGSEQVVQPLSQQDKHFLRKAAQGGALQIALSKVEASQGTKKHVKMFAAKTVENMSKAGQKLHKIAGSLGMQLPSQPPADVRRLSKALAADQGGLVDSEYIAQILPASVVAVNLFNAEAQHGKNPKLVQIAKSMLPKLQKQHRMVLSLSQGGNPSAGAQPSTESKGGVVGAATLGSGAQATAPRSDAPTGSQTR